MASVQPPRKRVRGDDEKAQFPSKPVHASLFAPFRALGLVTNHVPFAVQTRTTKGSTAPPRIHIVTCLGRSWLMWEGDKMTLLFVGTELERPITFLLMDGDAIWAAAGSTITKFLRGKPVAHLENPFGTTISTLSVLGSRMIGVTENGSHLLVWDMNTSKLVNSITFHTDFQATRALHPATYINKVVVASTQGSLQLWNISTGMLIHEFKPTSLRPSMLSTQAASPVTALVQSPAVDVVGIGFASGEVSIYDIRADERLLSVNMGAGMGSGGFAGHITAIGFRADGEAILATASSAGHIAFWDLNSNAALLHIYRGAHDGAVTSLEWIPGQPLLLSSGDDNSVKQWLFDSPTEPPRLLKFRGGHQAPPHLVRYYGEDGKQLLTASRDRSLRYTSVVRDSRSFELSQGSLAKKSSSLSVPLSHFKFTPVTSLSFSSARSKDWDDVLTAHASSGANGVSDGAASSYARTWSVQNKRLGRWTMGLSAPGVDARGPLSTLSSSKQLDDPASVISTKSRKKMHTSPGGVVRSVFVTACGNFGLAGSSTGHIVMWNMQSGIRRRTFDVGPSKNESSRSSNGHEANTKSSKRNGGGRPITGVAVDPLSKVLVATTLDGTVNFFDFHTTALEHVFRLPSAINSLLLQPDSGLLAVTCDDLTVRIVDLETRRVVREYSGFRGRILDVTFSPDSRWLVVASLDSIIRTFDVPTGKLIDAFKPASVATSISFSPTGDFLATAHVDTVGVYLWANRAQYAEVSLQTFDENATLKSVALPSLEGLAEDQALDGLTALTLAEDQDVYTTPEQLGEELVTLTLLPRSRWQTLLNLETITQRNKPKEPPKAPEKAPFFLPSLPGVEQRFDVGSDAKTTAKEQANPKSSHRGMTGGLQSEFQRRLLDEDASGDYENFFSYMKTLSPAAVDLELRSLADAPATGSYLATFLNALAARLRTHRDFEAAQTFLAVFLRLQGTSIVESGVEDEVQSALERIAEVQSTEGDRVLELVSSSLGTLSFVRDAS